MAKADSPTKICTEPGCGKPLRARGLCSTHYNNAHQPDRHAAKAGACAACGAVLARPTHADRRPACSVACRTILTHGAPTRSDSSYSWTTDAVQRARQAGAAVVEPFEREAVFERDGWICYLCGDPVDRHASVFEPLSATVDHVTPLSQGGEHSMRNARTAHLGCNSSKQDH